ncbi:MAG: hypothetical protein ABSB28_10595 [Candidatus Bathyarchaeia archaeon]
MDLEKGFLGGFARARAKEKLNFTRFYRIFPGGIPEVCKFAEVPVPIERIKRIEKAMKASRDEEVKGVLTRAFGWEKRRDKAKALLDAEKREKEAKLEALRMEAQLDPRKIPAYLEEKSSPLLSDLREACAIEKDSLQDACLEAVEYWDSNARSETKTFEDYIEYCLSNWAWWVRLCNATKKYSGTTFGCRCPECNGKYEYATYYDSGAEFFKCPNCGKTVCYPCPICMEAWRSEKRLEYDPKRNTLHCSLCGSHFDVTPPALNRQSTAYTEKVKQQRRNAEKQDQEMMKRLWRSLMH